LWSKYPEIASELKLVEECIRENSNSRNKLLLEVTRDLIEAGGKRLRPAFAVISSKFGRYDREKIIPLAGAMEILHTATLVHDDIIDRSKLRRGRATVSEKYGADMAVYTGDFLLTRAVLMLSRNISVETLERIAKGIKSICEGEVDQFQDAYNINTTVVTYLKRINRKTAVLFSAACGLGADTAGCPIDQVRNLTKFGTNYGMAFQIRDDINDYLSDVQESGKPVGNDIIKGTVTLPLIYALNKSDEVRKLVSELFENKCEAAPKDMSNINMLIKECGAMDYSTRTLRRYIGKGIKYLRRLPDNEYKSIFEQLIKSLDI
jgi:heptaprenyl diphosphate synthase